MKVNGDWKVCMSDQTDKLPRCCVQEPVWPVQLCCLWWAILVIPVCHLYMTLYSPAQRVQTWSQVSHYCMALDLQVLWPEITFANLLLLFTVRMQQTLICPSFDQHYNANQQHKALESFFLSWTRVAAMWKGIEKTALKISEGLSDIKTKSFCRVCRYCLRFPCNYIFGIKTIYIIYTNVFAIL